MLPFSLVDVEDAARLVHSLVPPTPQYAWPMLSKHAGAEVWVVCEGELRYLLLFPQGCPVEALEAIGESGRPLGLARVGHEALSHMRAARRTSD